MASSSLVASTEPPAGRLDTRSPFAASGSGAASAAAGLLLQGATATSASAWAALDARTLAKVLDTRFGTVWGAGGLAWLAVAGLTLARPHVTWVLRPASVAATELALPAAPAVLGGLGLLVAPLALLPALGGHASFQAPVALLLPANLLHVVAIGTWLGGLAVLLVAVPAATKRLSPANRTRLLVAVLARFSTFAAVAVTVVLASGVTQAVVSLKTPAHLLDTAYGRAVLVKAALFTALVALGSVNRRRRLPALRRAALEHQEPGHGGLVLRRTLRAELTLALAVFAATGALAGSAPASALRPAPTAAEATIRPGWLHATEDPPTPARDDRLLQPLYPPRWPPVPGHQGS